MRALALVPLALLFLGCKDVRVTDNRDAKFLHQPSELAATAPPPQEPFFPKTVGMRWQMVQQEGEETNTLTKIYPVGNATGYVIDMQRQGKSYRDELYIVDGKGSISQSVAGGVSGRIAFSPPLPIVEMPLAIDKAINWQGTLQFQNQSLPGRATSRFWGMQKITVPAGSFDAYRFESVLIATINGQPTAFPTTRWFVPGIGIVRTRTRLQVASPSGGREWREFEKSLVRYKKP